MDPLSVLLAAQRRRQRGRLLAAVGCGSAAGGAAVLLLGLSGWFITAASAAGLAGAAGATAFNALLPSAAIRLVAILRTSCRYGERLIGHDAALRAMGCVRPALFRALAASPPDQALAISAGDATARVVQDVGELEVALVQRSNGWGAGAAAAAGCGLLLVAGPWPAAALAAILAATLLASHAAAARLDAETRAIPPAHGALRQEVATLLAAAPELRSYGLEDWAAARIADRSLALLTVQRRASAAVGGFDLLLATAAGVAAVVSLALARSSGIPLAALAGLSAAASVEGLAGAFRSLQHRGRLRAAEQRIGGLLGQAAPAQPAPAIDDVAIRLPGLARPLAPGMIVGIAGPSGCGKTTLLETLVALRPSPAGAIHVGASDLASLAPAAVRQLFSLAPQDAGLITGTVGENLRLADADASDGALWNALRDADLDERIRCLPHGLDTWIGENGMRLSGGERRRLALARAMLRDAPWLLLDEPTEGLDARTEARVMERLQARLAQRKQGAIIVSHRPRLLNICQTVVGMPAARARVAEPPATRQAA